MRKRSVLILLLILLIAVPAGIFGWRNGWLDSLPLPGLSPKSQSAREAPPAAEPGTPDVVRPTFDVVRAEPSGDVVMAGRAEPGWTVSVDSGDATVGTAVANADGEWVIQPSKPLAPGEHSLELRAQDPSGGRTAFSKQQIMLSLSDRGSSQPLVALTEEGKETRVLQMPPDAQSASAAGGAGPKSGAGGAAVDPSKQVSFASIDYEDAGKRSAVRMNGHAAPGARISLYLDNDHLGTVTADAAGSWAFSGNRVLMSGGHDIRADAVEGDSGKVIARAEVKFDRDLPQPVVAQASPDVADDTIVAQPGGSAQPQAKPGAASAPAARTRKSGKRGERDAIIVRRGDSLWQIAQRYYGDGAKYTQIFRNNKGQIRSPDLIYPNQRFTLPK